MSQTASFSTEFRRLARTVAALLFLGAFGCGSSTSSAPADASYDSHAAHATLTAALDAWKEGKVSSLAKRSPPIRFIDDELQRGLKLSHYELVGTDSIRPFTDVPVLLHLKDGSGKVTPRKATYQVTLEPHSVLRSDT